jgi:hypothetical protein
VAIGKASDDDCLASCRRPCDEDLVTNLHHAVRSRGFSIHIDLAALARSLRLGPRAEQTGDVEPDVQTHRASIMR